ncbi:MAG: glycine cleavage system aminomethyltransferase GcvT [Bacteroidota bacterium]
MNQRTTLYPLHEQLGAKLIPFAGYDMPVRYTGDKQEHLVVRSGVGVFDVSHMGEFIIRGPKALALIQQVSSNDASRLIPGKAQYSCMPNFEGGIVDDMIVYHIRDDQYMIVANASNIQKDWDWIAAANEGIGAEMIDISDRTSLIAVAGPLANATLQKLAPEELDMASFGTYECWKGTFNGAEKSLIATTGYTGERTFEVFVYNEHAERMWHDIMAAGAEFGIQPCGLGARDTLRLEMGYMLYGNDINDETSPLEAGLSWITKLKKGEFNGSDWLSAQKEQGVARKLVGFKMTERGIPRSGYSIVHEGKDVGTVTSGTMSPVLSEGIGLGYVPVALSAPGTALGIQIRNKTISAEVVKPPFLNR